MGKGVEIEGGPVDQDMVKAERKRVRHLRNKKGRPKINPRFVRSKTVLTRVDEGLFRWLGRQAAFNDVSVSKLVVDILRIARRREIAKQSTSRRIAARRGLPIPNRAKVGK